MALKQEDIKQHSTDELVKKLADEKLKLQKLRFSHAASPLDDTTVIGKLKKDIARLNTELRSRELQQAEA